MKYQKIMLHICPNNDIIFYAKRLRTFVEKAGFDLTTNTLLSLKAEKIPLGQLLQGAWACVVCSVDFTLKCTN
jgi:hypothetical protein